MVEGVDEDDDVKSEEEKGRVGKRKRRKWKTNT